MNIFSRLTTTLAVAAIFVSGNAFAGAPIHSGRTDIHVQPVVTVEGEAEVWLHAGIEAWDGDITYQIGYPASLANGMVENGYFPFSELKFPLGCVYGTIEMNAIFHDKFIVNGTIKKNISSPNSDMEDRDWITESNPSQLDIYSESNVTDFSSMIVDVDLEYKFMQTPKGWLAGGVGFLYQDFLYETALVYQGSPSGIHGFDYVGDGGTSIDYEATFHIPYLVVSGRINPTQRLHLSGRLAFSPYATGEDRDQHLLRYKENKGDLAGTAYMLSLAAQFDFTPRWFMTAGLDFTSIEMDGDQVATFYGIYDHTVSAELESTQTAVFLTTGYRFGPDPHENVHKMQQPM